jgi:hypothetical protein
LDEKNDAARHHVPRSLINLYNEHPIYTHMRGNIFYFASLVGLLYELYEKLYYDTIGETTQNWHGSILASRTEKDPRNIHIAANDNVQQHTEHNKEEHRGNNA